VLQAADRFKQASSEGQYSYFGSYHLGGARAQIYGTTLDDNLINTRLTSTLDNAAVLHPEYPKDHLLILMMEKDDLFKAQLIAKQPGAPIELLLGTQYHATALTADAAILQLLIMSSKAVGLLEERGWRSPSAMS
jgi:hypothetical protein